MEDQVTPRPPTAGVKTSDCTDIALRILEDTFTQQGRAADWAKVKAQWKVNTAARGGTGLSGLDVLTIVRCASLDTACILITAFGDSETVAEASDLGARVFQKPFDIDELVTTLVELAPPS